jgi:hypothetical protein
VIPVSFKRKGKIWNRTLPATWDELTRAQLLRFSKLLLNPGLLDDEIRKMSLVHRMVKIPNRIFFNMTVSQADDLFNRIGFLFKECTLTRVLIKNFWHRGRFYIGPQDKFSNVVVQEYGWWDKFFVDYCESKDPRHLDLAIACVYRPISFSRAIIPGKAMEDLRIPFNMFTVEKRADRIAKLPAELKQAIFLQFAGIRQNKIASHPRVYRKTEVNFGPDFGFLGVILDLAGAQFGTVNQVNTANMDIVLTYLEKAESERERHSQPTLS